MTDAERTPPARERYSLIQVAAVIGAMAAAFWALHLRLTDQLRDRVTAYEQSDKWELPALLGRMAHASERLDRQLSNVEASETLAKRSKSLESELAEATKKLEASTAQTALLEAELGEIRTDVLKFTLSEGDSKTLAGNIPVGLASGSSIHECEIVVDNRSTRLKPGGYVSVDLPDKACRVIVEQCDYSRASFLWTCNKPPKPAA